MKSTLVWIGLATMLMAGGDPVSAWGGVFNRFTPELLGNLGYGGGSVSGGNSANALFYEVCLLVGVRACLCVFVCVSCVLGMQKISWGIRADRQFHQESHACANISGSQVLANPMCVRNGMNDAHNATHVCGM